MKMKIYSATGHRPDKLGGYDEYHYHLLVQLAENYLKKKNPDSTISGLALGWDTAWATASINLGIPLVGAVPFEGQESKWGYAARKKYNWIVSKCDEIVVCNEGGYSPWKMQTRNEWMVDNSTKLISLFDGSPGGTHNCVNYALKRGRRIRNLWSEWQKLLNMKEFG